MRLDHKVCLVTRGEAMDGPATAAEFLDAGAIVILQTLDTAAALRELHNEGVSAPAETPRLRLVEVDFRERGERTGRSLRDAAPPRRRDRLASRRAHVTPRTFRGVDGSRSARVTWR